MCQRLLDESLTIFTLEVDRRPVARPFDYRIHRLVSGPFDPHHFRTEIGKEHRNMGSRPDPLEFDDFKAFQRSVVHSSLPILRFVHTNPNGPQLQPNWLVADVFTNGGLVAGERICLGPMALFDPLQPKQPGKHAGEPAPLVDGFGRRFSYLRLSLTDRCNFRCTYCLPQGFVKQKGLPAELSPDEFRRAVSGFSRLGLRKVRLTGGEPTVRPDFTEIANGLSSIESVERIAMTTNGYRLAERAAEWHGAGIDAVNVSIDTLDPEGFARLTGHDRLSEVIAGVDAAIDAGYSAVKINSVLLRDLESTGWDKVLDFVAQRDVTWRFIELMRTNDNVQYHEQQATPGESIRQRLLRSDWTPVARERDGGPAIEYCNPNYRGRIGLIAPYSPGFCDSCNRLRLSSRGRLHLCLFGKEGFDLRPYLQSDDQQSELIDCIVSAMPSKTKGHRLHDGDSGATPHLASIGG